MAKTSNERDSMDGTVWSNSTYDGIMYYRMQQEQATTTSSTQKNGRKKGHSKQENS